MESELIGEFIRPAQRRQQCARALFAAVLAAVLLACFLVPHRALGDVAVPSEYQLKGAFLLNFAKFIEWPAAAFSGDKSVFAICVFGADPFGSALDDIARGKLIDNHELSIRRSSKPAEFRTCQLVFIGDADSKSVPALLEGLKGTNALVVGENEGFAQRGGGIQFVLENGKIRFLINVDTAQRAGLKVSSKLLALAQIVHDVKGD
jgi:hypothetical protein